MNLTLKHITLGVLLVVGLLREAASQTIYFLVEEFSQSQLYRDSCVIPLSDPGDIQHARLLIADGLSNGLWGPAVAIGRWVPVVTVAAGQDGINRNYLAPGFPQWSWHVVPGSVGWGEVCDPEHIGTPTDVENNLPAWLAGSHGLPGSVCLISYAVTRELGPNPILLSIQATTNGFQFVWSNPGTNFLYTLEYQNPLNSTNWLPVPGANWPLQTNQWTLSPTNLASAFYRVRAE